MSPLLHASHAVVRSVLRWLAIAVLVGLLAGAAAAGFLAALDLATDWREAHRWIIALLPLAGLAIGWLYHVAGHRVEGGNNLVLEEIHEPRAVLPLRMTPMILVGTVATHLFGGSAGREGTAVQMGASLADQLTRLLRLDRHDRRILLMTGISGGFGAVFGTPLAGAVFGMEVLVLGTMRFEALFPCLVAAIVGDRTVAALGVHHTAYPTVAMPAMTPTTLLAAIAAGAAFGLTAMAFSRLTHGLLEAMRRLVAWPPLRLVIGGAVVAAAAWALGSTRWLGLGVPVIVESFQQRLPPTDFVLKLAFTAVTLGCGFKGGEVTPLFFIGATLGSALSGVLPLPTAALAGMGFAAVFAGAANTPLACTIMAIELFGHDIGIYAAVACVASYLCSGRHGIYRSQRVGHPKPGGEEPAAG